MRQAKIKCPHCKKDIVVREALKKEQEERILKAVDSAFDSLEAGTKRIHTSIKAMRERFNKGKKK